MQDGDWAATFKKTILYVLCILFNELLKILAQHPCVFGAAALAGVDHQ